MIMLKLRYYNIPIPLIFPQYVTQFLLTWPHNILLSTLLLTCYFVLRGPDIYTLIEWGQEAISKALNFGHENGLEFGADKTEVVVFTRKRLNTLGLPRLSMANRDLSYSDTVKYLGVLLDSKLTYGAHIREKVKKATRLLYCFKTSVGQLWGPSPYLTRWVLKGIVLPKIMYGAMVWVGKASNYKKHLDRVKRLDLLAMAHV